jgi:hypothetical protein
MKCWIVAYVLTLGAALAAPTTMAITIPTVPIGNPGNRLATGNIDAKHPNGIGAVAYPFRMGKTEVTNAQYVGRSPHDLSQHVGSCTMIP